MPSKVGQPLYSNKHHQQIGNCPQKKEGIWLDAGKNGQKRKSVSATLLQTSFMDDPKDSHN